MSEVSEAPPKEQAQPILKDVGVIQIGENEGRGIIPYLELVASIDQAERPKVVILLGEATGVTPSALNPAIENLTNKGVPVFVVSSAYAEDSGMRDAPYDTHRNAANAGAIHLRDANARTVVTEVAAAAQNAINEGKLGKELKEAMIERFGSPQFTSK